MKKEISTGMKDVLKILILAEVLEHDVKVLSWKLESEDNR